MKTRPRHTKKRSRQQRFITLSVVALILLAVLLVILDWKEVSQIPPKADLRWTLVALLFTVLSFLCLSFSFVVVNRFFGIHLRLRSLLAVGFVSSALDNILSFLGAAGHSLRLVLLRRDGITSAKILAASIFHSYLNNMVMLFLLPLSLLWLLLSHAVSGGGAVSLGFTTGLFIFFLGIGAAIVFINWLRFRVLTVVSITWHFITRHNITRILTEFDNAMRDGVAALGVRGIAIAFLLLVGDWAFAVIALRFCFAALGDVPRWNILLAGFGFGISAGNVSMIPGGLGIQEASMAGVFAALGANFAQAVLVAILFRVVYDFIPFFVSLAFYRRLMRRHDEHAQET